MKPILYLAILLFSAISNAADTKSEWQNTTLTEATMKKIQDAKYQYKKCVVDEMQKPAYREQDTRHGTETLMKQCEPVLAKMRDVYLAEKVPEVVADRHLKQMRIQTTRSVLQSMMFNEAARASQK